MNDEDLDGFILSPRLTVAILGPPPALTPEAAKMHTLILWAFAETIKPRDMIEWIYVRDCADYQSEIIWLRGLKIRIVKKPNKDLSVSENNKLLSAGKVRAQSHRDKAAAELASKIKELKGEPDEVKEQTVRLEAEAKVNLDAAIEKIDIETLKEVQEQNLIIESEINDADSLNAWIGPYEQAEERLQIAEQKFEDTLRRLDEYKHGMGERLRKVSNAILTEDFYELLDSLRAKPRAAAAAPESPDAPTAKAEAPLPPEGTQVQS
jgi:hypothetical protein